MGFELPLEGVETEEMMQNVVEISYDVGAMGEPAAQDRAGPPPPAEAVAAAHEGEHLGLEQPLEGRETDETLPARGDDEYDEREEGGGEEGKELKRKKHHRHHHRHHHGHHKRRSSDEGEEEADPRARTPSAAAAGAPTRTPQAAVDRESPAAPSHRPETATAAAAAHEAEHLGLQQPLEGVEANDLAPSTLERAYDETCTDVLPGSGVRRAGGGGSDSDGD